MKRWQVWLGFAVSFLFLFIAFQGLNFREVYAAIRSAEMIWLLPAIPVYMIGVWLRAFRWKIFLNPLSRIKTKRLFSIVAIGYMGNNIFPARLGELVRAAILKKDEDIAISGSLATIIIERLFDGIIMLGFILLNISVISQMSHGEEIQQTVDTVAAWGSGIFLFAFLAFLLSAIFPIQSKNIINGIISWILPEKWYERLFVIVEKFFTGIQSLSSPIETIKALLISILIWLIETLFYWAIMQAFPFNISFGTLMLLNGFLNLFTIIPSSPGYIGTFDAPGIALLTALGISSQIAAGFTLFLHASLWLPVTLLGAYFFIKEGITWTDTIRQAKEDQSQ